MQDKIIEIIKDICVLDNDDTILEKKMRSDLMISSLDYVKMVTQVEDELFIELPDEILIIDEDIYVSEFIDRVINTIGEK